MLVRNLAEEHDTFDVLVHGPAAAWATVEPATLTVAPGDEGPVWVRFAVPRDGRVPAGAAEFVVTVASRNDPDFIHAERGELHVDGFSMLRATLDPVEDAGRVLLVRLHLANDGNAPGHASVRVRGVATDDRRVQVVPGADATVEFELRRERDAKEVLVEVAADGGETFSLAAAVPDPNGNLRRDLTRSASVLGALLLAAFLAVALVGGGADGDAGPSPAPLSVGPSDATATSDLPAGVGGGETSTGSTGSAPAIAANTGTSRPADGSVLPPPDDLAMIAFVRIYAPGDRDLVVRSPGRDGTEFRLRTPSAVESAPALSPDGTHVAFVQERGGAWRGCVAVLDGGVGEPACLFDVAATSSIAWRPDGSSLFAARGNELIEVLLDVSRSYVVATTTHSVAVPGGRFALSPDGTRVAVVSGGEITLSPIDGSGGLQIAVPGSPEDPTWTADGQRIVYTADTQLHVAPAGDGPIRQLTAPRTVNGDPVVVGRWVVFRSNRSGNGDLYAVALDGADAESAGVAQITRTNERDIDPSR